MLYYIPKLSYGIQNLFSKTAILFQTNFENAFLQVKLPYHFGKLICTIPHLENSHEKISCYIRKLPTKLSEGIRKLPVVFPELHSKTALLYLTVQFVISEKFR